MAQVEKHVELLRFFTTERSLKIYQAEIKEFKKQARVLEFFGEN
jgi:hypothetical protein